MKRVAAVIVVVLAASRAGFARAEPPPATTTSETDEDYVTVKGQSWPSPRGVGDVRVKRELLDASPRQQTSEMLSAAPGFFVDHEDSEGLGNDVYLRGFDLSHGSGIEMRLGAIPLNQPLHVQGQGYVDANFIIPEVVRSIRVLEGPFDPRQGDAAIVGSGYFDIGVADRGYQLKASYGGFNQRRALAIVAPHGFDDETFAAFSVRETDGFGQNRASKSASMMAQYAVDIGLDDRLKLTATAYGAQSRLAGVVRRDDVDAGRIGFEDSYPSLGQGQGVDSNRFILGADYDHMTGKGSHFEIAPWVMWNHFLARQNFTGNLEQGESDPHLFGLGDLYETRNQEVAAGVTARHHARPFAMGPAELSVEPGVAVRVGDSAQGKSLLRPADLTTWDRRLDVGLRTLDAGAWLDMDLRFWKKLRVSVGPRVDFLAVGIDDHLAGASRSTSDVAAGPRVTVSYDGWPELTPVLSYGEGFRSLNPDRLRDGDQPYSKVRSGELGVRSTAWRERFVATVAAFETYVANELVFEAEAGGLETEKASVRRGAVTSLLLRPTSWLLVSSAFSITRAEFTTLVPGISHYVPSIPSVLFRTDVTARGALVDLAGHPVVGRVGAGYTLLGGRHLTDTVVAATQNVLNASAGARWRSVELALDMYNVLGLQYADDEEVYASNWTTEPHPGTTQPPASIARHITAAPPRTAIASLTLYFQ